MRDRWSLYLVACATVCLAWWPAGAGAQVAESEVADDRSPIQGNVDVELGPYYPSIDGEFANASPFRSSFGDDGRILGEMGVAYYLFKRHGKLGLEFGFGYSKFTGNSDIQNGSNSGGNGGTSNGDGNGGSSDGGSNSDGGDSSGDASSGSGLSLEEETNFVLFPLRLSLTYRWDFLAQEFGIPLAPRLEGGVDYYIWKVTDGSGNVARSGGEKARGAIPGYHVAAGVGFLLDFITPGLAAAMDINWGVNNTYLFGEYEITRVQPFQGGGFNLSDETWKVGLSFEF
jgi:hypothetical protein